MITQEIHNLIEGISQQPPISRHQEQLEEQINGFSSEVNGLQKRPPTVFRGVIDNIPLSSKVHIFKTHENEEYVIALTGDGYVRAWDLQGNKKKVKGSKKSYLVSNNPHRDFKVITIADYSFILNTSIKTSMSNVVDKPLLSNQGVLISILSGQYGRTYKVIVNGTTYASYTTPNGQEAADAQKIDTNYIRDQLASQLAGKSGIKVQKGNSWLYMTSTGSLNNVTVEDGFNGEALSAIKDKVSKFNKLPSDAPKGFTVKVTGNRGEDDDYYLAYIEGVWQETVKPNLKNTIDETTMPKALASNSDGTFEIKEFEWDKRSVGDEESNEEPSFIGLPLSDIFFFRNRLGLVAGENVCLSRSGDLFNFWLNSAADIVDTDTIDVTVSHNKESKLYHAVPYNKDLYLFSAESQFILSSDGVLSPKNCVIDQVTEFKANKIVKPIGVGKNLYFTSERLEYTTVNEYRTIYEQGMTRDVEDVTAHVPNLLVNGVYKLIANSNEHLLIALSENARDTMYIYKYLYLQDRKVQSSWSSWKFNGEILGAQFIGSKLVVVIKRGAECYIEDISIAFNTKEFQNEPQRVFLDNKREEIVQKGVYNEELLSFEYNIPNLQEKRIYEVVLENGFSCKVQNGKFYNIEDVSGLKMYVGEPYQFKATLTTIYVKKEDNKGRTIAIPNYRLNIRSIRVNYAKSGEFDVEVEYKSKPKATYKMTSRIVGSADMKFGTRSIQTGAFKVPIHSRNTEVKISITNESHLPSSITNIVWEGIMSTRHRFIE